MNHPKSTLPPDVILQILTSPAFDDMFLFFNLLRCTMLNRTWRSLIYNTNSLRTCLFLAPLSTPLSPQDLEPGNRHITSTWNYPLNRAGYQPLTIYKVHIRLKDLRGLLHPIFDATYDDRGARGDFAIPPALADYPGGLFAWVRDTQSDKSVWWDMFVTSPPTTRVGFTICQRPEKPEEEWWDEFKYDGVLVEEWLHERVEGVRIRDVMKILCEGELPQLCREGVCGEGDDNLGTIESGGRDP
jgi:hypothetical protein